MPDANSDSPTPAIYEAPKRRGISSRMAHGIGAGIVATLLSIAGNLLLLPLYLRHWSVTVYGEWMALYSVVSYIGALDIGLTTAATNAAAHAFAGQRWPEFKRIQGTAWALSLGFALVGAVIVTLAMTTISVQSMLRLHAIGRHDSNMVIIGLAVAFLITIPGRQLGATYIALGEFAKYQWIYNAGQIVTLLSIGVALCLGATPATLALIVAAATIAAFVATYALIWHRDEELLPAFGCASWSTARSLATPSGEFVLQMFGNLLTLQGPVIVISRALGGHGVALFTTTRTVSNVVKGVLTIFRAPLRSEYAAAYAQPTRNTLRSLFRTVIAIDTTIAVTLAAGLWTGGALLIRFWSHQQIVPESLLLHLLLILSLFEGLLWMMAGAGNAANRFHGVSWGALAYALSSVLLAFMWVGPIGLSAVPASGIVCLLAFMLPFALRNARLELQVPVHTLITKVCFPFLIAAGISVGTSCMAGSWFHGQEWMAIFSSVLTACIVSVITTGTIMMTSGDRQMIFDRLRRRRQTRPSSLPSKERDHLYVS